MRPGFPLKVAGGIDHCSHSLTALPPASVIHGHGHLQPTTWWRRFESIRCRRTHRSHSHHRGNPDSSAALRPDTDAKKAGMG